MDKIMKDVHILNGENEEIFVQRGVTSIKITGSTIEVDNDNLLDLHSHKYIVLQCLKGTKIIID